MSIAFYPDKGLVCYGSEQAAVKAGMNVAFPGDSKDMKPLGEIDEDALRLDLDDVGGEVVLLDWGTGTGKAPVSQPYRHLVRHKLLNEKLQVVIYQESPAQGAKLYQRMQLCLQSRN